MAVTVERMVYALFALMVGRVLILECRRMLKELPDEIGHLRPVVFMMYSLPVGGLMTKAFGAGELRDQAFEVLGEMVKEEVRHEP